MLRAWLQKTSSVFPTFVKPAWRAGGPQSGLCNQSGLGKCWFLGATPQDSNLLSLVGAGDPSQDSVFFTNSLNIPTLREISEPAWNFPAWWWAQVKVRCVVARRTEPHCRKRDCAGQGRRSDQVAAAATSAHPGDRVLSPRTGGTARGLVVAGRHTWTCRSLAPVTDWAAPPPTLPDRSSSNSVLPLRTSQRHPAPSALRLQAATWRCERFRPPPFLQTSFAFI